VCSAMALFTLSIPAPAAMVSDSALLSPPVTLRLWRDSIDFSTGASATALGSCVLELGVTSNAVLACTIPRGVPVGYYLAVATSEVSTSVFLPVVRLIPMQPAGLLSLPLIPPTIISGVLVPVALVTVAGGGAFAGVSGGSFSFSGTWHLVGYVQSL
jgi:hypothetical protein